MSENVTRINLDAFPDSFADLDKSVWNFQKDFKEVVIETSDKRLEPFLTGWTLSENYEGDPTFIPDPKDSTAKFEPIRYFKVIKEKNEKNYRKDERDNEICLTLWAHWRGYDHECEVNLFITGKPVKAGSGGKVSAEILKAGGAPMEIKWNGKSVTKFEEQDWFFTRSIDKAWIDDMNKI